MLVEQQRNLPALALFRKRGSARANKLIEVGLKQLRYSDEYKQSRDVTAYLDQLTASIDQVEAGQIRNDLSKLTVNRQNLLEQLVNLNRSYLDALSDLKFNEHTLQTTIQNYNTYINQRLFWVRSGKLPDPAQLLKMPSQLTWLVAPALWHEFATALGDQTTHLSLLMLGLLIVALLTWKRKSIHHRLEKSGTNVNKLSKDNISITFRGLGLTLLLAAPGPLLLSLIGWILSVSSQTTTFTNALSYALLVTALHYFGLSFLREFCDPTGVAIAHFKAPVANVCWLRRELGYLMLIFLPFTFLFTITYDFDLTLATAEVGRSFVAAALISLTFFFYRATAYKLKSSNPPKSAVAKTTAAKTASIHPKPATADKTIFRQNRWLPTLATAPFLMLVVFDFAGYIYTVSRLTVHLLNTLWFILTLILIRQVTTRWIILTQRRLKWNSILEKRALERAKNKEKAKEDSQSGEVESEFSDLVEPEVDFMALSKESRQLINAALILLGFFGLLLIWADVLPAFSLLDDITLWHYTNMVAGEKQLIAITLLDLSKAATIAFITIAASKYLPSLLEIIMLQRTSLVTGSRYTVTTITNYTIIAVGTILFCNTIGWDWSKIQWLIAALGVGIGFGLQEIVANFISGLIILFERPIRVGDVVSVGDNDAGLVIAFPQMDVHLDTDGPLNINMQSN